MYIAVRIIEFFIYKYCIKGSYSEDESDVSEVDHDKKD